MTAASDAHHSEALGTAYTILHTDDFSVGDIDICRLIKFVFRVDHAPMLNVEFHVAPPASSAITAMRTAMP